MSIASSTPASEARRGWGRLSSRELALVSIFAAVWIAAQVALGPIVGRFSVGPISLHGVVNRLVGWMLMPVLAALTGRFGRVSTMALVAAIGTRSIRASLLSGLATGAGYALGGLTFDILYFRPRPADPEQGPSRLRLLLASAASGILVQAPYLLLESSLLSPEAFLALTPSYAVSTAKGAAFSVLGTALGISLMPRIRLALPRAAEPAVTRSGT